MDPGAHRAPLTDDFDADALECLRGTLARAPGGLESFLELYLAQGQRHVRSMEEAVRHGDLDALERAAHALKPSSALVGALALSDACRTIENTCRSRSWNADDPEQRVQELQGMWRQVEKRLAAAQRP